MTFKDMEKHNPTQKKPPDSNLQTLHLEGFKEVRPKGFEPLTDGLEIRCSIQLSYGRKHQTANTLQPCVQQDSNLRPAV